MTQLDFISGMKRLSSYYFKELTNDQLVIWYEMFKDVSSDDFNQAIKEFCAFFCSRKRKIAKSISLYR